MKCPSCKRQMPDGNRFCANCGTALADGIASLTTRAVRESSTQPVGPCPVAGSAPDEPASAVHGRFLPGTLLANRYRVVELLGKGGMGEVYRADDLKLSQTVALKFLPSELARDPERLAFFHNEVRLAREVTHPNVCRVHDIGEVDGQQFLSMEYIDGEDLASLVRRVGRLSPDKGVDVARQLCAGLAAAHDKGVLHRDLKPANVMLDGRGHVRITDFGVAQLVDRPAQAREFVGTPAYMAPEQLARGEVSVQSDLYAFGLVLFELFTGQSAFQADTLAELLRLRQRSGPTPPSTLVAGIDPVVERTILECLEPDPTDRPSSALAVAAALPGGDVLTAAVAAGETPSPEMVAAAGASGHLALPIGVGCLVAALVGLVAYPFLADRATVIGRADLALKPDVLENKARELLTKMGYEKPASGTSSFGFDYDRKALKEGKAVSAGMYFWHRQSPYPLLPMMGLNAMKLAVVRVWDPPFVTPGMVRMRLDTRGLLQHFQAVPDEVGDTKPTGAKPDWAVLFAAAGLDVGDFEPVGAASQPHATDGSLVWQGRNEGAMAYRVEARVLDGQPTRFRVRPVDPDTDKGSSDNVLAVGLPLAHGTVGVAVLLACSLVAALVGALLARRNMRLGRGDRTGAARVSAFYFISGMLIWLFGASHSPNVAVELLLLFPTLILAISSAVVYWLFYLALEPYVRRVWPEVLISWRRLLAGRVRDPRVGRDLLIGVAVGVWLPTIEAAGCVLAECFGTGGEALIAARPDTLVGVRQVVTSMLLAMQASIGQGLFFMLFPLLVLRLVCRRMWLAGVVLVVVVTALHGLASPSVVFWVKWALVFGLCMGLLIRYGLLAFASAAHASLVLQFLPVTARIDAWYWGRSLLGLAVIGAIAAYGFYTSLTLTPSPARAS